MQHLLKRTEVLDPKLNAYVRLIYDVDTLNNNLWVKWCCACMSAVQLMRRGGGPVPDGLREEYEEFMLFLKEIKKGISEIPSADRMHQPGLVMSNVFIDPRYYRAKVRVQPSISAGEQNTKLPRRNDISDIGLDF